MIMKVTPSRHGTIFILNHSLIVTNVKKDYQVNVKVFAGFNKKRLKKYKILY